MKRKTPYSKTNSIREPFVAGFILPVLLLAAFAPTLLFQAQGDVPGDPVLIKEPSKVETPSEKEARMLAAFDNSTMIPGTLIVSFENGTTLAQANAILQPLNLSIDQKQICTSGQAVDPDGTTGTGPQNCYSDGWLDSITAGRVLVSTGEEKKIAQQLYNTPGIVWVEPDYTASIGDGSPSLGVEDSNPLQREDNLVVNPIEKEKNFPTSNKIFGIEPIMLVVGVLVVGFGAYFAMSKK